MAKPKPQKIIEAIVTRMALIDGTGEYLSTIDPTHIADSRPNWDEAEFPAISVFEGRTESTEAPRSHRHTIHTMPVLIKGFLKRGTTAENARNLIADIKRAILNDGVLKNQYLAERWPDATDGNKGLAIDTLETASSIEYAEGTFEVTGCQVEIEVSYITGKFASE